MSYLRRFKIRKGLRKPLTIVLNEITELPRKGQKTEVYWRGVHDGVKLVRKRAQERGINLDDPESTTPVVIRVIEIE